MIDNFILDAGETIRWQGRPAPRCYTFRNWKHSLAGIGLTVPTLFWLLVGWELTRNSGDLWTVLLPAPFVLASLYLAAGHLFLARLEWEKISYVVTDRRVALRRGIFRPQLRILPLNGVQAVKVRRQGLHLATLRLDLGAGDHLIFHCLEHPEIVLALFKDELGLVGESVDRQL